jgi:hypothetical protein
MCEVLDIYYIDIIVINIVGNSCPKKGTEGVLVGRFIGKYSF